MIAVMFLLWQYLVNNSCMSALLTIFSIRIIQNYDVKALVIHVINLLLHGQSLLETYGAGYGRILPPGVEKFLVHAITVHDGCHRLGKHVIGQQVVDPVGLATIGRPYDHHG